MNKKNIILISIVLVVLIIFIISLFLIFNKKTFNNANTNLDISNNDNLSQNSSNNAELISSYKSGTTIVSFYKDGRIVVSDNSGEGKGKMDDYDNSLTPWNPFSLGAKMEKLIVENGVISLGNSAFSLFNLKQIEWSDDLEIIGADNFARMYDLELPTLPANLKEIRSTAFAQDFEDDENNKIVIPKSCTLIGTGAFYNAKIHHFIIESETLSIKSWGNSDSSPFWIGCKHNITIEVKNENVKQTILEGLNTDNGRINVIVKGE